MHIGSEYASDMSSESLSGCIPANGEQAEFTLVPLHESEAKVESSQLKTTNLLQSIPGKRQILVIWRRVNASVPVFNPDETIGQRLRAKVPGNGDGPSQKQVRHALTLTLASSQCAYKFSYNQLAMFLSISPCRDISSLCGSKQL
jgi:hypothetical protein